MMTGGKLHLEKVVSPAGFIHETRACPLHSWPRAKAECEGSMRQEEEVVILLKALAR